MDSPAKNKLSLAEIMFVSGEYIMAIGSLITSLILLYLRVITPGGWLCFAGGVFIGSVWENIHAVIGPSFLKLVNSQVNRILPTYVYPFVHAIADGLVMVGGLGLAWFFFRYLIDKDHIIASQRFTSYDPILLIFLLVYGLAQELIVELIFNGKVWIYQITNSNRALFWIGSTGYTVIPFVEWVIASIVFWIWVNFALRLGYNK